MSDTEKFYKSVLESLFKKEKELEEDLNKVRTAIKLFSPKTETLPSIKNGSIQDYIITILKDNKNDNLSTFKIVELIKKKYPFIEIKRFNSNIYNALYAMNKKNIVIKYKYSNVIIWKINNSYLD